MYRAQVFSDLNKLASASCDLPWESFVQPGREGVQIVRLYDTDETGLEGPAAALVRYLPNARVQRHLHPGFELIYVLEGELIDDSGTLRAGTLEVCPPGSSHALASHTGCTFLVVWEKPVKLVREAERRPVKEFELEYGS